MSGETLNELSESNRQNASLIENALEYAEYSLNIIRSAVEQNPAVYSAMGEPMQNNPGVLDVKN